MAVRGKRVRAAVIPRHAFQKFLLYLMRWISATIVVWLPPAARMRSKSAMRAASSGVFVVVDVEGR